MQVPDLFKKKENLVFRPEVKGIESIEVEEIHLTAKEAVAMGFSFRKWSKSVRITNYHGTAENLIIPTTIDGVTITKINARAFCQNQTIKKLQIPATVRKIGEVAFMRTKIESCLIADGLTEIPKGAFFYCLNLSEVHLPKTLRKIEICAFQHCPRLKSIEFPECCAIGQYAFWNSGLETFTISDMRGIQGDVFRNTPLEENYALILGNHVEIQQKSSENYLGFHVLKVGKKAENFQIPRCDWLHFGENSFDYGYKISLDMTNYKGGSISFHADAFLKSWRNYDNVILYFPEDYQYRPQLPWYMTKAYRGKTSKPVLPCIEYQDNCADSKLIFIIHEASIILNDKMFPSAKRKTIILRPGNQRNRWFLIAKNAFEFHESETVELDMKFTAPEPIFYLCYALHKVIFYEDNQQIIKYIPCSDLIGEQIHVNLLKAFQQTHDKEHFFDSQVILDIFLKQKSGVHTRHRIFIAIDALRSTKRDCDTDTEIYLIYLKRHIKKARQVCEKIKDKYPEYLKFLDGLPFGENIS